jgi:hypothetical protein
MVPEQLRRLKNKNIKLNETKVRKHGELKMKHIISNISIKRLFNIKFFGESCVFDKKPLCGQQN